MREPDSSGPAPIYRQPWQAGSTSHTPSSPAIGRVGSATLTANDPKSFMANYCDDNFRPLVANNPTLSAMQSCIADKKQDLCTRFAKLPADARQLLDRHIACTYSVSEITDASKAPDCDADSSERLRLTKIYWKDPETVRALIFLPDDIIEAETSCVSSR